MRPGDSPGPRRPFVGSGWTRTDRDERVLLAGSAWARARDIARAQPLRRLGRTGHPLARLTAMGSSRQRLSRAIAPAYPESLLASRCEREQPTSERLQAETPRQPAADSSEPALLRAAARCLPYLPRLGLRIVSRASVPPRLRQYPNTRCQCPRRGKFTMSFAPFGQFSVAHRPSVLGWLAGGSRAISTPACEAGHSLDGLRPTAYSSQRVQASEPLSPPSESQRR
jgi:hypothetical protein